MTFKELKLCSYHFFTIIEACFLLLYIQEIMVHVLFMDTVKETIQAK